MQEILLNIESKETRYAVLKNGALYDLIIERKKNRQLTGNVYRGRVTNILHNIQSAFIDIDEDENGSFTFPISLRTPKNSKRCLKWISISKWLARRSQKQKEDRHL